jgi:dihydrofolate reductase
MKGIIAINNLSYIGLKGGLPWKCAEDLAHFKKLTMDGNSVLVGWKTAQTLPELPGRNVFIYKDGRKSMSKYSQIDWCIGGKATYEKFCNLFEELHISHIDDYTEGDVPMPDFSKLNKSCKIYHYYFKPDAI